MSTEIERKFLVVSDAWRRKATGKSHIVQGYLARGRRSTIRVRIKDQEYYARARRGYFAVPRSPSS